jgi:MFS family permease
MRVAFSLPTKGVLQKLVQGLLKGLGPVKPYHALVFLGCWFGGIFDGLDSSLYMVVQHDAISSLLHTTSREAVSVSASWVMAVFLMGWTAGGMVFGIVGDRWGRVTAMVLSIIMYAVFTGLCGLAQTVEQLALFRFLTGFGIGGELVSIATMLTESWPEQSRALVIGFLLTSYQTGVFLAGLLPVWLYGFSGTLGLEPWRLVFFAGALPAVLAIVLRLNMKEPEGWLEHHKQELEQQQQQPASSQGLLALVSKVLSEMKATLNALGQQVPLKDLLVGAGLFATFLMAYWACAAWVPTWIQDLLSASGGGQQGTEKGLATMWHGLAAVLGCSLAGPLANGLGRKWALALSYLGILMASIVLFCSNSVFSTAIYWQNALLGFFYGLAQATLYIYLPELFPTLLRATATGLCLNAGRVATIVAVLCMASLVAWAGGYSQALLVFSLILIPGVLICLIATETKGKALR